MIVLDGNRIRLADSLCHATGCPDTDPDEDVDNSIPQQPLPLSPDKSSAGQAVLHQLFAPGQQPLLGLVNGQRYYIVGRTATSFQLALTPGGAPISLGSGAGITGVGRFEPAVADLGTGGADGQQLILDLTSVGSGTQALGAIGTTGSTEGGGTMSEAVVSGSGGGFVSSSNSRPTVTVSPTVTVTVGAGSTVTAGDDFVLTTLSNAGGVADATTRGLGFVSVGSARAVANVTATTTVTLGLGSTLTTGGSVTIAPVNHAQGEAYAQSSAGGLGHGVGSETQVSLTTTATTSLLGTVIATDDLAATSTSRAHANSEARASGASFAGSSSANDCGNCHVTLNDTTKLVVGGSAYLQADNVRLGAYLRDSQLREYTRAHADGGFEDSDADSRITVSSTVAVELLTGAKIVGYQTVDIVASHQAFMLISDARATCGCFGGDSDSDSNIVYNATSSVTAQPGVTIRTATLTVSALQDLPRWTNNPSRSGGFIDIGSANGSTSYRPVRSILWEADVILHAANPHLVVDDTGRIVKLYSVTVKDENGVTYGLGDVIPVGRVIHVQDIANTGGGSATFYANVPQNQPRQSSGPPNSTLTGTRGSFRVQNTFDYVILHNYSSRSMTVHGIAVANLTGPGATVRLQVDDSSAFRFSIRPPLFLPTLVDIENFRVAGGATATLTLDGRIDNPIGETWIVNQHGDVLAGPSGSTIRTNVLTIMANEGTIGRTVAASGTRSPINVILVQSDYMIGDVDPARYVSLIADALRDVVLDITYSLRAPLDSPFPAMAPVLGPIHAGRDVDLVVHDSIRGSDTPVWSSYLIQVNVYDPPDLTTVLPNPPYPTGAYHTYFHPDSGAPFVYTDPVVIAWGSVDTKADSAYTFPDLKAGNDITVLHTETDTTITLDVTTDVGAELYSREFPDEQYSVRSDNGEITLFTNGWILDHELVGDLRVGTITSTASDVTLVADDVDGSILDAGTIDDGTARVVGNTLTLRAGTATGRIGGTGAAPDFLEIHSSYSARGRVSALAPGSILLDQVAGTLYVAEAYSGGDVVSLRTRAGSILADAPSGTVRVRGTDVDLIAVGGTIGSDSGDRSADLVIDTATGGRLYATSEAGGIVGAATGIWITEATGGLQVLRAEASEGPVRLALPYVAGGEPESLYVLTGGTTIDGLVTVTEGRIVGGPSVTLLVGQDVWAPANTIIAADVVTIRAGFGQGAVAPVGAILYFGGEVTGHSTEIYGSHGDDVFLFDRTLLGGHTLVYGSPDSVPGAVDGDDFFGVWWLQSMTGTHLAAPGDPFAGTEVPDALVLYGQGGDNTFYVQTWGGDDPVGHDYRIVVRGGGAAEGMNLLTVDGTDEAELFLFRAVAAIPEQPDAVRPGFVAQINTTAGTVERITYDAGLNGGLRVNGLGGDDTFVFDDVSVSTSVYGDEGADTFVVGQFYPTPRIEPDVQPGDAFETVQTPFGYATPGVSAPTVLYGGAGDDRFTINGNRGELRVEAATGNDAFTLLAVPLTAGGYRQNGHLSLDGGADASTITVQTTGPASDVLVTEGTTDTEMWLIGGAGFHVDVFHLPKPVPVSAPFVAPVPVVLPGDALPPLAPIVIPPTPREPGTGTVIVVETDGSTRLITGVQETDSYTIALGEPPTERVYITISSAYGGGSPFAEISIDGGLTWATNVVLVFEAGETGPKTVLLRLIAGAGPHAPVMLFAAADSPLQGPGVVVQTLMHQVTSADPRYENATVQNVYINLLAAHEPPGPPGPPGPPDGPGGCTVDCAGSGALAATGGTGFPVALGAALAGLGLLLLGLVLLVLRRRRL